VVDGAGRALTDIVGGAVRSLEDRVERERACDRIATRDDVAKLIARQRAQPLPLALRYVCVVDDRRALRVRESTVGRDAELDVDERDVVVDHVDGRETR